MRLRESKKSPGTPLRTFDTLSDESRSNNIHPELTAALEGYDFEKYYQYAMQAATASTDETRWSDFLQFGSPLRIIAPERTQGLTLDAEKHQALLDYLEGLQKSNPDFFIQKATEFILLYPHLRGQLTITEREWNMIQTRIQHNMHKNIKWRMPYMEEGLYLFPERSQELTLTIEQWEEAEQILDSKRGDKKGKIWSLYINFAHSMLLLNPELRGRLRFDPEVWEGLLRDVEGANNPSDILTSWIICTANDARVTEQGLIIERPTPLPIMSSIPERKIL